jgi:hypothetical protein
MILVRNENTIAIVVKKYIKTIFICSNRAMITPAPLTDEEKYIIIDKGTEMPGT